jgi:hypothetical protein
LTPLPFLKIEPYAESSSLVWFVFLPNVGHRWSGSNLNKNDITHVDRPRITAISQWIPWRPPLVTFNASLPNSTMMTCATMMKTKIMQKTGLFKTPEKMFLLSLIILAYTMLLGMTAKTYIDNIEDSHHDKNVKHI